MQKHSILSKILRCICYIYIYIYIYIYCRGDMLYLAAEELDKIIDSKYDQSKPILGLIDYFLFLFIYQYQYY